jgi:hypothetical protein
VSAWDAFAVDYEKWAAEMTEDIPFYVELARRPTDLWSSSPSEMVASRSGSPGDRPAGARYRHLAAMLAQARANADAAGVELELLEGDMREACAGRARPR